MCGLGSMCRSGLGCTRRGGVVGCVGVDAYSVGRHALGWPGLARAGRVVMRCVGMTRKQRSLGAQVACVLWENTVGEHRVSIAALPMIWNGWASVAPGHGEWR